MRILAVIGAIATVGAVAAAVFFLGGFYSVAGAAPDLGIVHWALVQVRMASIARHANDQPPVDLNDPSKIRDGARAFAAIGCVNCHGAPGVKWAKFSEGLHPDPPDLKELAIDRTPAQLFWVIKNGINMTGMPSFALIGVADERLWSIAAFVNKLPTISEADYKAWTASSTAVEPSPLSNQSPLEPGERPEPSK
jgi:mono/diheme cytochrome c family protein